MMFNDSLPAIIVNVSSLSDEIDINNTGEVRKYLFNHFKGREIRIKSDGMLAFFGRNGLADSLKRKNEHRKVFSALDKIIEYSYPVGFQKVDSKHSEKRPDLRGQFIYGALISLTSQERPEQILALAIKLDDSVTDKEHLYFKDVSLIKMRPLYAGQTENPNVNLPADRTVFTIHDIIEIVKQKFKGNPLFSEKGNFISEKLEPSRVISGPSQNSFRRGYKQVRTISSFLRYDTPKKPKVKSELHKKFNFNGKGKNMQKTPETDNLATQEQCQCLSFLIEHNCLPEIPETELEKLTYEQAEKMISAGKKKSFANLEQRPEKSAVLSTEDFLVQLKERFEKLNPGQEFEKQPLLCKLKYLSVKLDSNSTISQQIAYLSDLRTSCRTPETSGKLNTYLQELKAIPADWVKYWDNYVKAYWSEEDRERFRKFQEKKTETSEMDKLYDVRINRHIQQDVSLLKVGDHAAFGQSEQHPALYTGEVVSIGKKNVKLKTQSKMYGEQVITLPISEYKAHYPASSIELTGEQLDAYRNAHGGYPPEVIDGAKISFMEQHLLNVAKKQSDKNKPKMHI